MHSFGQFVVNDWWIAIPMFLMSLTGVTLVVWRLMLNSNGNTKLSAFLPPFQDRLEKEGVEGALRYCRSRTDIIPRKLFVAGLETSKQGLSAVRRAMANVTELEILPDLNFLLPSILAIAKIATMVGLFGTVLSMIGVFDIMSTGTGDQRMQAGRIGLALFATALGLITAIPLQFSYVLLKAWMSKFEVKMKSAAQKLLLLLEAKKSGGKGAAAPAAAAATPATKPAEPGPVTTKR